HRCSNQRATTSAYTLSLHDALPICFLDAAQNARLIASAERYYRIMYYGGAESWNLRDTHMFETLGHLLEAHGPRSKAVVWAHNSDRKSTRLNSSHRTTSYAVFCLKK